ncbi:MAG: AAA family ATPase [Candidatus Woesearchaeota archaeon]
MIIGITGTHGAGKGTIVKFLKKKGFIHCSATSLINEFLDKEGMAHSRDDMRFMANKMRADHGNGFIAKIYIERAKEQDLGNIVIESIRHLDELKEIKDNSGIMISVDAPICVRYERIISRRSSKDAVDFETFKKQEELELNGTGSEQQIRLCMEHSDYSIYNDGTIYELDKKLEELFGEINS